MKATTPKPYAYKIGNSASHLIWLMERNGGSMTEKELVSMCRKAGVGIDVHRTLAYNTDRGHFVFNAKDGTYSPAPKMTREKAPPPPEVYKGEVVPPRERPPFRPLSKEHMPTVQGRRADAEFWSNVKSKYS